MRRSLAGRCFGTLLALWFAISIAEPQWLHACPMHNAPASGDAPAGAHGSGHHAGAGRGDASHAPRSGHSAHGAGTTQDAASHRGHSAHGVPSTHDAAAPAGHHGADLADAGAPVPSPDHAAAHCLCLGDCAPGVAVTLGAVPEVPVAMVVVIEARGALPRADYVPVVRDRTLPFATAPPAL